MSTASAMEKLRALRHIANCEWKRYTASYEASNWEQASLDFEIWQNSEAVIFAICSSLRKDLDLKLKENG